jgi:diguanylate cyclase (GGDEF)-like protein
MRIREIPVIVITGAEDEPAKQRAYACGATDFVIKPIDGVQLLARTRAHLKLDQVPDKQAEATAVLAAEEANRDPLTQLYNRRFFMQRGEQDISFAKRHNSPLSLVKLDIDNLKTIFDKYGDHAADNILVKLAKILAAQIRQEDTAGRLGGTEFAVLLTSARDAEATVLAERLCAAVNTETFEHEGARIPITISVGVVTWDDYSIDTIEKFLAQAEKHLRLAKSAGGNRFHSIEAKGPAESTPTDATGSPAQPPIKKQPVPTTVSAPAPTVDSALEMLAMGDIAKLEPHLPALTLRILPLLDLCNKRLGLGLTFAIESLKEKLVDHTK